MTIRSMSSRAPGLRNKAEAVCDECGRVELVVAAHQRSTGGSVHSEHPVHGQVMRKLTAKGWEQVKNRLLCLACARSRRGGLTPPGFGKMEDVGMVKAEAAPRAPTREEKRQIVALLEVAYDLKAGRYKGSDTDRTIAEAIGGGVLPGWVAQLREDMFGPDGGNVEMDRLKSDIAAALARLPALVQSMAGLATTLAEREAEAKALQKDLTAMDRRLGAICAAVGPKAGRA